MACDRTTLIRLDEVRWGGVRQDGIPPLRRPKMIGAHEGSRLLGSAWPRHFSVSATKNVPRGGSSLGFPTDFAVCLFDVGTDAKLLSGISEAIDEPEVFGEVDVLLDLVQRRSLCI